MGEFSGKSDGGGGEERKKWSRGVMERWGDVRFTMLDVILLATLFLVSWLPH
jgi:hypothetical protein